MDCEGYNYEWDENDLGKSLSPMAALFDGIPGFNAFQVEELLHDLPVPDHVDMPRLVSAGGKIICYIECDIA